MAATNIAAYKVNRVPRKTALPEMSLVSTWPAMPAHFPSPLHRPDLHSLWLLQSKPASMGLSSTISKPLQVATQLSWRLYLPIIPGKYRPEMVNAFIVIMHTTFALHRPFAKFRWMGPTNASPTSMGQSSEGLIHPFSSGHQTFPNDQSHQFGSVSPTSIVSPFSPS